MPRKLPKVGTYHVAQVGKGLHLYKMGILSQEQMRRLKVKRVFVRPFDVYWWYLMLERTYYLDFHLHWWVFKRFERRAVQHKIQPFKDHIQLLKRRYRYILKRKGIKDRKLYLKRRPYASRKELK